MKSLRYIYLLPVVLMACMAQRPYGTIEPDGKAVNTSFINMKPADSSAKKPEGMVWLDFESGYAKAIKENKILLVDVYTDWCGWCKVMDRKTYTNDTVLQYIKAHYVAVKMNPEKDHTYVLGDKTYSATELHAWLGYGKTFGYPTTYFWLKPGSTEERYAAIGYNESWDFINILQQVKNKKGN